MVLGAEHWRQTTRVIASADDLESLLLAALCQERDSNPHALTGKGF